MMLFLRNPKGKEATELLLSWKVNFQSSDELWAAERPQGSRPQSAKSYVILQHTLMQWTITDWHRNAKAILQKKPIHLNKSCVLLYVSIECFNFYQWNADVASLTCLTSKWLEDIWILNRISWKISTTYLIVWFYGSRVNIRWCAQQNVSEVNKNQ